MPRDQLSDTEILVQPIASTGCPRAIGAVVENTVVVVVLGVHLAPAGLVSIVEQVGTIRARGPTPGTDAETGVGISDGFDTAFAAVEQRHQRYG